MNTLKYIFILSGIAVTMLFNSCVDAEIGEAVDYKDYYLISDDSDASVMGIYGKVMGLADRLIVLNELRGDLLDVTKNADDDLIEINNQKASRNNYWADVTAIYEVIQNCNDALYNFKIMVDDNRITNTQYKEVYSDIAAIRSWLYYQLGVHFGKVPYITDPIVSLDDVLKQPENLLDLDQLIPELIRTMENLPTLENYVNSKYVSGTVDGISLPAFFINKKCLLGDLYLFNNEYDKAATIYREVLAANENADVNNNNLKYRVTGGAWASGDITSYFAILFNGDQYYDYRSYNNSWINMFKLPASDRYVPNEMIWEMSYDYKFAPKYPFIELFGNEGRGKYMLKPSTYAIDEMWGSEVQKNDFPYDCRGVSGGVKETSAGEYVVAKYLFNYNPVKPSEQQGKWYLYRAALLHLRFAEAANRSESGNGYPRLAWALVNDGIRGEAFRWKDPNTDVVYRGDSIDFSGYGPGIDNAYPAPYFFDGRYYTTLSLRLPWRSNIGIRGRANLPNVAMPDFSDNAEAIKTVEQMIIKEAGLELAYEGHRWTDLIRVARRLQKIDGSGGQFLYDKLHRKYELAGLPVPDFSNPDNWYLPLFR